MPSFVFVSLHAVGFRLNFAFLVSRALATSPVALASKGRHCLTVPLATLLLLCGVSAGGAPVQVSVRDVAGAAVPDAVVHANPIADTVAGTRPRRNAVIEQIGREFVPQVTVVQAGTTVAFPNRDRLLHHVYSFSPAKTFEIKLYSGAAPFDVLFDKAGLVTIGCNIHDWMIAYVYVVDTPSFGRSDSGGKASIGDMPAGDYDVHIWHPQQRSQPAVVRLKVDGKAASELTLTIDVAPRRPKFKPPANPAAYQ